MSVRRFPEDYDAVLYAADLAEILRISTKRVYALAGEGAFDDVQIKNLNRMAWSRDKFAAKVNGQTVGLTGSRSLRRVSGF